MFGHNCVANRSPALKFSPCYFSKSPLLELPRVRSGPSVKIHQSWKYPCIPDPASPLQSLPCFWCCPSPAWPRANTQSHGDLQRRQPTRLLLALFSLISDFHCWMNSSAGSLCFCPERGEPQLKRRVFPIGQQPPTKSPVFVQGPGWWWFSCKARGVNLSKTHSTPCWPPSRWQHKLDTSKSDHFQPDLNVLNTRTELAIQPFKLAANFHEIAAVIFLLFCRILQRQGDDQFDSDQSK